MDPQFLDGWALSRLEGPIGDLWTVTCSGWIFGIYHGR